MLCLETLLTSDVLQRKDGISGDHVHHLCEILLFQIAKEVGMQNSVMTEKNYCTRFCYSDQLRLKFSNTGFYPPNTASAEINLTVGIHILQASTSTSCSIFPGMKKRNEKFLEIFQEHPTASSICGCM